MFARMGLGNRLNLIIISVNLTILVLVALLANSSISSELRSQAVNRFNQKSENAFTTVDTELNNFHTFATTLATGIADFENINRGSNVNDFVISLFQEEETGNASLVHSVSILRPDGTIIWVNPSGTERSAPTLRVISASVVQSNATFQSLVNVDNDTWLVQDTSAFDADQASIITLAVSYQHAEGEGLILLDMLQSEFQNRVVEALNSDGLLLDTISGYILILDDTDNVIDVENLNESSDMSASVSLLSERLSVASLTDEGLFQINDPFYSEQAGLVNVSQFSTNSWRFIALLPVSEIPALPSEVLFPIALVGIPGIIILIWAVNRFIESSVVQPLVDLGRSATEIGDGNLRFIVFHKDKADEIGRLANAMDAMRNRLRESYNELETWSHTLEERVGVRTEQLREARKDAERNAQQIQVVYDESLSVVNEAQLQPVLDTFIDRILMLLDANYCAVWLLDEDRKNVRQVATNDTRRRIGTGFVTMMANQGIVGEAIRLDQPVIVNDYKNYENRVQQNEHYGGPALAFSRGVCTPLKFAGFAIGAVVVGRVEDSEPFNLESQRQLTLFTNIVAPSVRNAQLFTQLQLAVREAERANEVKTRFLASVTHELRTPLNLIINNMDFMRVGAFGEVTDDQINRLNQTVRSAEHLLYLINDLLDVSKIDAGEMQLFIQDHEVYTMLEDAVDNAFALLDTYDDKADRIELRVDIEEDLPEIPMDARRIRQVLNNLLSNGIKFTQDGVVTLKVFQDALGIHFSVHDTGMGIPQDEMKKLFLAFERTNAAKQHGIEGTGLGLPISRYMVQKHGSDLTVSSDEGAGTTFTFTLPFEAPVTEDGVKSNTQEITAILSNKKD